MRGILGVLAGCGEKSDSFHLTRSSPDGKAIITSIERAIADAGVEREAIGYINAHGTGTPENDKMECLGVMTVFGERASAIPISSNKSMIGHTLSAARRRRSRVHAPRHGVTGGFLRPSITICLDPAIPLDVVPNVARDVSVRHAISNSFGFGGQNVSLGPQPRAGLIARGLTGLW